MSWKANGLDDVVAAVIRWTNCRLIIGAMAACQMDVIEETDMREKAMDGVIEEYIGCEVCSCLIVHVSCAQTMQFFALRL